MAEPVLKVKRVRSRGVQKSLISDTTDGPVGIYSQAAHSTVICDGFRVRVKASFVLISHPPSLFSAGGALGYTSSSL